MKQSNRFSFLFLFLFLVLFTKSLWKIILSHSITYLQKVLWKKIFSYSQTRLWWTQWDHWNVIVITVKVHVQDKILRQKSGTKFIRQSLEFVIAWIILIFNQFCLFKKSGVQILSLSLPPPTDILERNCRICVAFNIYLMICMCE